MKYEDFTNCIRNFEEFFWFGEYVYYKALECLKEVRADLGLLDTEKHMKQIIKTFLIQWGRMGRTVDREDLDWMKLTQHLRKASGAFQKLQRKSLLSIDFRDKEMRNAIKEAYSSARIKFIGATAISKILHLLNPELFVMWDEDIRTKIYKVAGNEKGYLEFLEKIKEGLEEAINDGMEKSSRSKEEIINEICKELPSKKLGIEHSEKTLAKLADEYNWWVAHYKL